MTKAEFEKYCERLNRGSDFYESILYDIKKMLFSAAETFKNGLAEETDFSLGVQHALDVVASIINSKINKTSYLYCPSFKNIVKEQQKPAFTIIESGLSKKNKEVYN